jgi:hypothetical protein
MATKQQSFFARYLEAAQAASQAAGIPVSAILAQAAHETGWGGSTLALQGHNLFGIKAGKGWTGQTISLYDNMEKSWSNYRVYDSDVASFRDWATNVVSNPRYAKAKTSNPFAAIAALKEGGYATDKDYVSKVTSIINQYDLTQYDNKNPGTAEPIEPITITITAKMKDAYAYLIGKGVKPAADGSITISASDPVLGGAPQSLIDMAFAAINDVLNKGPLKPPPSIGGDDWAATDPKAQEEAGKKRWLIENGLYVELNWLGHIVHVMLVLGLMVVIVILAIRIFPRSGGAKEGMS